ncbi:MAG: hypothetical protein WD691_04480 [Acidimicrobiales bacterium]
MVEPPIDDAAPASGALSGDDPTGSSVLGPAEGSDGHVLANEAEEIRRLVDAGADSPEALRDLAARLREHREREDSIWRAEVKPALVKENKGRLRGHRSAARAIPDKPSVSNAATYAVMLVVLLLMVVVAASTTVWLLVLPVLVLVGYAWKQGRQATRDGDTDRGR